MKTLKKMTELVRLLIAPFLPEIKADRTDEDIVMDKTEQQLAVEITVGREMKGKVVDCLATKSHGSGRRRGGCVVGGGDEEHLRDTATVDEVQDEGGQEDSRTDESTL